MAQLNLVPMLFTKQSTGRSLSHSLYSIWLFTFSDIKTIIIPQSTFGLLHSICADPVFGIKATPTPIIQRTVFTFFWVWVNLLPFNISNQIQPLAIEEDKSNKPWRPLPSKRLTPQEAKVIMLSFYMMAILVSMSIGGHRQCVTLIMLGYWYNNLEGAGGLASRNFINACGFLCFATGATEVALGIDLPINGKFFAWMLVIGFAVFTTVQTQDMYDQAGDAIYGRKTLPLVVGDGNARWITAGLMVVWSIYCPSFWNSKAIVHVAFLLQGILITTRLLVKRTVENDKVTFRIWNTWILFLYSLPFLQLKLR